MFEFIAGMVVMFLIICFGMWRARMLFVFRDDIKDEARHNYE